LRAAAICLNDFARNSFVALSHRSPTPYIFPMVRIAISPAAFDALAAMLSLGSVGYKSEVNERGERLIWLQTSVVDRLMAMREPSESYSDVILRLIEVEVSIRR
jgi:hypothetical protein